jgi:hypothetical protein
MLVPLSRSWRVATALAVVFLVVEGVFRAGDSVFRAASHRVLSKAELLDRHGSVELLFVGSSRSNDAIAPAVVSHSFNQQHPSILLHGFDLTVRLSSKAIQAYLVDRFAERAALRVVFLEVSAPQLAELPLDLPLALSTPLFKSVPMEVWLTGQLSRAVRMYELRRAFIPENLLGALSLVTLSPAFDGSEVLGTEFVEAVRGRPSAGVPSKTEWTPTVVAVPAVNIAAPGEHVLPPQVITALAHYKALHTRLSDVGVRVVFWIPPLRADPLAPERSADYQMLLAEIARTTRAPIWDFAAEPTPSSWMRDAGHMNLTGKHAFSWSFGQHLAKHVDWFAVRAPDAL